MMTLLWFILWAIGTCIMYIALVAMDDDPPKQWDEEKRVGKTFISMSSWVGIAVLLIIALVAIFFLILGCIFNKWIKEKLLKFETSIYNWSNRKEQRERTT